MEQSLEIRFHGRGGQGVVTASNLLAEAAGYEGLFASAFPIYGAERRGAEIESYCRIS
ncbi:MAG: 2-oxoacid:acceptor oxidoreductase family protein, partial [Metallosphaera sp.]